MSLPHRMNRAPILMYFSMVGIVDAAHAGVLAVLLAGGDDRVVGAHNLQIVVLAGDAHLEAQVIGADEEHVHSRHRGDGVGLCDRVLSLQHHHEQCLLVDDRGRLCARVGAKAELRHRTAQRAMAHRRVLAVVDELARLLGVIHVREHDAHRSGIQQTRRQVMLVSGHAHERCHLGVVTRHGNLRRRVDAHRVVLHVDEGEVESTRGQGAPDVDSARLAERHAERQLAGGQTLPDLVRDRGH
jgi:hypothetical protein